MSASRPAEPPPNGPENRASTRSSSKAERKRSSISLALVPERDLSRDEAADAAAADVVDRVAGLLEHPESADVGVALPPPAPSASPSLVPVTCRASQARSEFDSGKPSSRSQVRTTSRLGLRPPRACVASASPPTRTISSWPPSAPAKSPRSSTSPPVPAKATTRSTSSSSTPSVFVSSSPRISTVALSESSSSEAVSAPATESRRSSTVAGRGVALSRRRGEPGQGVLSDGPARRATSSPRFSAARRTLARIMRSRWVLITFSRIWGKRRATSLSSSASSSSAVVADGRRQRSRSAARR